MDGGRVTQEDSVGLEAVADCEGDGEEEGGTDPVRVPEEQALSEIDNVPVRDTLELAQAEAAPDCEGEAEAHGDAENRPVLLRDPAGDSVPEAERVPELVGRGLREDERETKGEALLEEQALKSGESVAVRLVRADAEAQLEPVGGTSVRVPPPLRVPAAEPQLLRVPLGEPVSLKLRVPRSEALGEAVEDREGEAVACVVAVAMGEALA